ncbi:hypothetical protein JCM10908_007053 [Rhodotorula pacifica]|uniref:glycosyltransferase family 2 protein n=1 Tax=Rhodotorula pacifica TaxID=1495444 RepID=UPI003180D842
MRFHVNAASCQLSSRPVLAAVFSLAVLVLLSHLGGASPRRFVPTHAYHAQTALSTSFSASSRAEVEAEPEAVSSLLESLINVPDDEVGELAICASLRNEGRFIIEWLLYYRILGVDRFYLYDSGSEDDTLERLQPWMKAGTVKLQSFRHDQVEHYQTTALETCSRTYGPVTEWLVEADCDEFYVITPAMTASLRSHGSDLSDVPRRPLAKLLAENWIYKKADAVVVSRLTWKNAGIDELPPDASVLASQTLREYQHAIAFDKNAFTKSILHTKRQDTGWTIPGAHFLRNRRVPIDHAKIVTANGQPVDLEPFPKKAHETAAPGTQYAGKYAGVRAFEPLVLYHYVQRGEAHRSLAASSEVISRSSLTLAPFTLSMTSLADLQDCYRKLSAAQKLRKGGWRDQAGEKGCTDYVVYEADESRTPIYDAKGFYGASLTDTSMASSWFGRHLPLLIAAAQADHVPGEALLEPQVVDPHPDLVAQWVAHKLNPENGMPLESAE